MENSWLRGEATVRQLVGTHLRVVKRIHEGALGFDAELFLASDHHRANARSMLDLMQLAASPGDIVRIESRGAEAAEALRFTRAVLAATHWNDPLPDAPLPDDATPTSEGNSDA